MALITWSDDFSVGIDSIDDQHKKLVNMINGLNDALEKGEADAMVIKIFGGLAAYTQKHFAYEEELFDQHGYPDTAAHKQEHAALIDQVVELKQKLDAGDFMISSELMDFLKAWLTKHIMGSDKKYSECFISHGVS